MHVEEKDSDYAKFKAKSSEATASEQYNASGRQNGG